LPPSEEVLPEESASWYKDSLKTSALVEIEEGAIQLGLANYSQLNRGETCALGLLIVLPKTGAVSTTSQRLFHTDPAPCRKNRHEF
jgi:hypothetical protein